MTTPSAADAPDAVVVAERAIRERAAAEQAAAEHAAAEQAATTAQLARATALEHAIAAEEEAAVAIRERDAAAARAHDALERAARERLILESSADNTVATGVSNVHDAMLLQEAAAVLNLHAQAVAVQNIRSLVPLMLDLASSNYNRWRESMLLTLGKYSLQDHVLSDAAMPTSPDWARMNCVVKSWLLGTISTDLFDTVINRGATARTTWLALESQFLGNRETRALYLDAEFRNFVQGDLSITEYCRRLKGMADALSDLGEVVTDRTLVLNLLRGLNEQFASIGRHLKRGRPFPTFLEARSDLLLEELTQKNTTRASSTALVAHTSASTPSQPQVTTSNSQRHKRGGRRGGQQNNTGNRWGTSHTGAKPAGGSSGSAPQAPWPNLYNPWTGSIQMWPDPRPPLAPLPPRPVSAPAPTPTQAPQAFVAGQQDVWASPYWDQQTLASNFSTMTLQQPQQH